MIINIRIHPEIPTDQDLARGGNSNDDTETVETIEKGNWLCSSDGDEVCRYDYLTVACVFIIMYRNGM